MGRLGILFFIFLLAGCCAVRPEPLPEIVTRAEVIGTQDGVSHHATYTDPEKLKTILDYLRHADPSASEAIAPDTFRTDGYEIRLTLLDGRQTLYRQLHDQYLQKNGGPWRHIQPSHGSTLQALLQKLTPDV